MIIERDGRKYYIRDLPAEARELGLPEDASRQEIDTEKERRYWAKELGLPDSATIYQIIDAKIKLGRIKLCRERGLPETSSWTEIEAHKSALREKLGLPSWADWWEIDRAEEKRRGKKS